MGVAPASGSCLVADNARIKAEGYSGEPRLDHSFSTVLHRHYDYRGTPAPGRPANQPARGRTRRPEGAAQEGDPIAATAGFRWS